MPSCYVTEMGFDFELKTSAIKQRSPYLGVWRSTATSVELTHDMTSAAQKESPKRG